MGEQDGNRLAPLDYATPPPGVPRYRKILSGILIGVVVGIAVTGLFAYSESAGGDICVAAGGLVVFGLAIRFQHVRP